MRRIQDALAAERAPAPADLQMLSSINADSVRSEIGSPGGLDKMTSLVAEFARRFGLDSFEISKKISRYEASAWRRGERTASECPRRRAGRPEEFCWEILRIYGRVPAARTIRRMLEGTRSRPSQDTRWPRASG